MSLVTPWEYSKQCEGSPMKMSNGHVTANCGPETLLPPLRLIEFYLKKESEGTWTSLSKKKLPWVKARG